MSDMSPEERWEALRLLQEAYPTFGPFLYDVMHGLMGFEVSDLQLDIGNYLEHGPLHRMIQAQRSQAKTTITAIYAVWRLIQKPNSRILIISAGGDVAIEVANWVIQIINNMPELECLRPDRSHGDRASVKSFDIHYILKGPEKSPSVACIGIEANMQGRRADVLIPDDIESSKNSQTAVQREKLIQYSRDFTSICGHGDIIYLGTPQSVDSIYNGLPGRGYDIRIWPGRYPTEDEEENYGSYLAPFIRKRMTDDPSLRTGGGPLGDRGQATDPVIVPEAKLVQKQIDQGSAYFQLQHMLDTRLADAERFPLKVSNIRFASLSGNKLPMEYNFVRDPIHVIPTPMDHPVRDRLYRVANYGLEFGKPSDTFMYIDPAGGGQNGDETAWAVTQNIAGFIVVRAIGVVPGGLSDVSLTALVDAAFKWKPKTIGIEENYGKGALSSILKPKLAKVLPETGVIDIWETQQKELRIIDTLEPIINNGRLVMAEEIIAYDWEICQQYPIANRVTFSLLHQISRITRDRDSLIHDDRLDALNGAVRFWVEHLEVDKQKAQAVAARKSYEDLMNNPLGNGRPVPNWKELYGSKAIDGVVQKMRHK